MRRPFTLAVVSCLLVLAGTSRAKDPIHNLVFSYDGHERRVYYEIPAASGLLPVVVLLHGSGRDGTEMIKPWQELAASKGIILVAPDAMQAQSWDTDHDPPAFLHAAVEQVSALHAIDQRRIYLFGQSGGAVFALALSLVDSQYYAATAVHAGALPLEYQTLFQRATRHMPVAVWSGDRDPVFPPERVKATKAMFDQHGFQLKLTIVPNHNHSYDQDATTVNLQAWDFLKDVSLP